MTRDLSLLPRTAELNNQGIDFEHSGNIEAAISCYEENVQLGYPATHAYDRLMILYRKLKRIEDEIRIIKAAILMFDDKKYATRLLKAIFIKHGKTI